MHDFLTANVGRAYPCQRHDDLDSYPVLADLKLILRRGLRYSHAKHQAQLLRYGWLSSAQAEVLGEPEANRFVAIGVQTEAADIILLGYGFTNERFEGITLTAYPAEQVLAWLAGGTQPPQPCSRLANGWALLGDAAVPTPTVQTVRQPIEPTCLVVTREVGPQTAITHLYNQPLTQYSSPLGCLPPDNPEVPAEPVLACEPKQGTVRLLGGNQIVLRQDGQLNELVVAANARRGGAGDQCEPVPLSKLGGEELLDVDTAPRCHEVVRGINGLGGPSIGLYGFNGVGIRTLPAQHRVIVGAAVRDAASCDNLTLGHEPEAEPIEDIASQCNQVDPAFDPALLPFAEERYQSMCRFRATAELTWEQIGGGCGSPYVCHQPDFLPTSSEQTVVTPCVELSSTEAAIINPYFEDLVDFNGWDRSPAAQVQRLPDSYLEAAHLPAAKLSGGDWLRQRRIQLLPGDYVLQADVLMLSGRLEFTLVNSQNGATLFTHSYIAPDTTYRTVAFDPRSIHVHTVDLFVRYIGGDDPAYISFFALTMQ